MNKAHVSVSPVHSHKADLRNSPPFPPTAPERWYSWTSASRFAYTKDEPKDYCESFAL
jgi:hypothetical protein